MNGDLFILNQPKDPSWFFGVSDAASTWLWEHGDLIPLLLGEVMLAAVIVAVFVWRERRQVKRTDAPDIDRIEGGESNNCGEEDCTRAESVVPPTVAR